MSPDAADLRMVIGEAAGLLGVFAAQLRDSLRQANQEFAAVGAAFLAIAAASDRINSAALGEPEVTSVRMNCDRINRSLATAVAGLQSHDRLTQRLVHTMHGLEQLRSLLADGNDRSNAQWLELLRGVDREHQTEHSRLAAGESAVNANSELF